MYRSVSNQVRSQKRSEAHVNFTKAKREAKVGHFKDAMATKPTKVVIPMPKIK